jgi:hypothetical protein
VRRRRALGIAIALIAVVAAAVVIASGPGLLRPATSPAAAGDQALLQAACSGDINPGFENRSGWTLEEIRDWCAWVLELTLPTLPERAAISALELRQPRAEAPLATFPAEVWAYRADGRREMRLVIWPHNAGPTVHGIEQSHDSSAGSLALRWQRP